MGAITIFVPKWYVHLFGIPIVAALIVNIVFICFKEKFAVNMLKEHHEVAGFIVTTLGALYGVIIAFTIVGVQSQTINLRRGVNKEAYLAVDLFKASQGISALEDPVYKTLFQYLESVVNQEWTLMPKGEEDPATLEKLKQLWNVYYSYRPKTLTEDAWLKQSLSTLQDLNKARMVRIYDSWDYLSALSWLALIVGGVVMIGFLFCFGSENTGFQAGINFAYTFFIIFLFMIVYQFNHPFIAPLKLGPKSYETVYNYYKTHGIYGQPDNFLKAN